MVARREWYASLLVVVMSLGTVRPLEHAVHAALFVHNRAKCDPTLGPWSVSVTPTTGAVTWNPYSGGQTSSFTVTNGQCGDTYSFTGTISGPLSGLSLSPASQFLNPLQTITVTASYRVGGPSGTGVLTMTAQSSHTTGNGAYNITVKPPSGAPLVDLTPFDFDNQSYARCAHACFAATASRATVPYYSLDAGRNVVLVYNGDRVNLSPFVLVNVTPDTTYGSWPTQYEFQVKVNGAFVRFLNGEDTLLFAYNHATMGTAPLRIGGQFSTTNSTRADSMDVLVSAYYAPTTVITSDVHARLVVVDETSSPVARGWSIGRVQRLYPQADGSALVADGDGSAIYFLKWAGSFVSPAGEFSSLVPSTLSGSSGWARLYPDSTKVVFNSAGLMTQVLDRFGNRDSVVYDASNRVSQIIDPLNYAITLSYGSSGLSSIRDALGRVTNVSVDANARLTTVTDPDNGSTRFGYDASLRLDSLTDRRGATAVLSYDAQSGKLQTITAPQVSVFGGGNTSPVVTLVPWQKSGVPYRATVSSPDTAPQADTVRASVTEPGGAVSRFTVNRWGSPATAINALAETTSVTFDPNGMPIRTVYPTGGIDTASYSTSGLMTYHQAPGLSATNILYAAYAVPDSMWGTGQVAVRSFVGANGRVDSTRVGGAAVTRYHYETHGRVDSIIDPLQHLIVRSYFAGALGDRSKDSTLLNVTTYVYDAYGRDSVVRTTGVPARVTLYDQLNRVTQYYDSVNTSPTLYGYDQEYPTTVTDPKSQVFSTTYNALGWVTARKDPAGDSTIYQYSVDGDLKRVINRRGQNVDLGYDALHRVTSKSGVNTPSESWLYTGSERVLIATSSAATDTVYLNLNGAPDSTKTAFAGLTPTFLRTYSYTSAGLTSTLATTGAGLSFQGRSYGYNTGTGLLTSIGLGSATTSITSSNDGLPTSVRLPAGDTLGYKWTAIHRSMSITTNGAYKTTVERQLSYDDVDRIAFQGPDSQAAASGDTAHQYNYDGLSRLVTDTAERETVVVPASCNDSLSGSRCTNNIHNYWIPTGQQTRYGYDPANNDSSGTYLSGTDRITGFNGCTYNTDVDGNVTSRSGCLSQTVNFVWQAENRLDSINISGTGVKLYYDALGRLVRKDVNGAASSYYLWDGANLLAELNGTATQIKAEYSYYPAADNLHAIIVSGHKYYAHADGLGNVIALTDSTQALVRTYKYGDRGQLTGGTDSIGLNGVDRARWKGALWLGPEFDVYYMRSRWYEPVSGRFLSEDPVGLAGGINPYVFGGGDPINRSDPQGSRYADCNFPVGCGEVIGDASGNPFAAAAAAEDAQEAADGAAALGGHFTSWQQIYAFIHWSWNSGYSDVKWENGIVTESEPMTTVTPAAYRPPDRIGELIFGYNEGFAKGPLPRYFPADWTSQFFEGTHFIEGTWDLVWSRGSVGTYDLDNGRYDGYLATGYIDVFHGIFIGAIFGPSYWRTVHYHRS